MRLKWIILMLTVFTMSCSWAATLRDPTQPVIGVMGNQSSNASESRFQLQSILIAPKRRLAMINGQMVGVGSSINGARVLAIDKNRVILLVGGSKQSIYLLGRRLWTTH